MQRNLKFLEPWNYQCEMQYNQFLDTLIFGNSSFVNQKIIDAPKK